MFEVCANASFAFTRRTDVLSERLFFAIFQNFCEERCRDFARSAAGTLRVCESKCGFT